MTGRHYYSVPALAISALFGGPLSAVAFAAIEARALDRLRKDVAWLAAGVAAFLGAALLADRSGLLGHALEDLGTQHLPVWAQVSYRLLALVYVAGYLRLHRADRRGLAATGIGPLAGYGAGVIALLVGLVAGTAILLALR